jgi:NO-binding membrane sensor protein with MHYT domain
MMYLLEAGAYVLAFMAIIKFEPQIGTVGLLAAMTATVVAVSLVPRLFLRRRTG